MKKILSIFLMSLTVFAAAAAMADTRYVSDELTITLRQGMSEKYKILKLLTTGTPIEVLEEEDKYFRVRAKDGTEGYVLKQYVTAETPKTVIISRLEKEVQRLKDKLEQAENTRSELKSQVAGLTQTEQELAQLTARYNELEEKSKHVVELATERDRLQSQNEKLSAEAKTLREENEQMFFTGMIKWFLAGGGVFLGGWVVGKISRKKKRMYSL